MQGIKVPKLFLFLHYMTTATNSYCTWAFVYPSDKLKLFWGLKALEALQYFTFEEKADSKEKVSGGSFFSLGIA